MYIIAIAWLYVAFMMALTEHSITAGVATFLFYGLFPLALFLWLVGTPQRKRNKQRAIALESSHSHEDKAAPPPPDSSSGAAS